MAENVKASGDGIRYVSPDLRQDAADYLLSEFGVSGFNGGSDLHAVDKYLFDIFQADFEVVGLYLNWLELFGVAASSPKRQVCNFILL